MKGNKMPVKGRIDLSGRRLIKIGRFRRMDRRFNSNRSPALMSEHFKRTLGEVEARFKRTWRKVTPGKIVGSAGDK
jgi:hypothetical protein